MIARTNCALDELNTLTSLLLAACFEWQLVTLRLSVMEKTAKHRKTNFYIPETIANNTG